MTTRLRVLREHQEGGFALVFVVGSMLVLAMLAMAALAYTISSTKFARYDQDHGGAMSAAQSGIEDFAAHLNRDDEYYKKLDCDNKALEGPMTVANLCSWNAATTVKWLPVTPGKTGPKDAFFHYSFDASAAQTEGTIIVRSTGKVNGRYRTVEASLTKGGSTDYVYYTDFESADPANVQAYNPTKVASITAANKPKCGLTGNAPKHFWEGREGAGCVEIQFVSGDELVGSVFSNDSVLASGPKFDDTFTSANPTCANVTGDPNTWKYCLRNTGGSWSTADFSTKQPQLSDKGELLKLDDNSAKFAEYPGCHYFGSTRIKFNPSGTMTVWNKTANNGGKEPVSTPPPAGTAPSCGTLGDLNSLAGATVAVPQNMVVYTSGEPTGITRSRCDAGQISGDATYPELPLGTFTKAVAAAKPATTSSKYTYDETMTETTKFCQEGNVYIEGVVKGRVTVAAEQSVVLTGDLVLAGGVSLDSPDMVGLVATNSIEVFHPWMYEVAATGSPCPGGSSCKWNTPVEKASVAGWPHDYADPTGAVVVSGITIMASIQTLQHSFYVQKYDEGTQLGQLQVNGSIAQRWRGIVGQASTTGYLKHYVYDGRLKYSAPPYFPRWVNAQWTQRYFGETTTPASVRN